MDCPVCHCRMNRVGLDSVLSDRVLAEFECPKCHTRVTAPPRA